MWIGYGRSCFVSIICLWNRKYSWTHNFARHTNGYFRIVCLESSDERVTVAYVDLNVTYLLLLAFSFLSQNLNVWSGKQTLAPLFSKYEINSCEIT